MKQRYLLLVIFFGFSCKLSAQPNFTANDIIKPYDGVFRPGVNFDIYPGFTDQDLASLAAGVANSGVDGIGAKALRPSLPESFLEQYGYDIRLDAFKFYDSLGLKDNTLIVGFPSEAHRDTTFYCPTDQSTVFKNMYEPIWDNGENGTPVNDNNYMALYIWKLVNKYKNYVKFYEIWNEPGFDFTGNLGWRNPGDPVGNWWDRNPAPCEYKLRAPIFNYIRILRIAYEVIKTIDPNAYVTTSGLGYASFMDAILRNTDNPDNGKPTPQYPFGAGAYIDGIGYHVYPHFDDALRSYNVQRGAFDYYRHSDAAGIDPSRTKEIYDAVLRKYGYDGVKYPKKNYIITEANLPRKQFGNYIGSSEAQKNWIIKAYINCVQNDIWQMHIFKIAEQTTYDNATREFDVMGLYQQFDANNRYGAKVNDEGIAYGTTSKILFNKKYDAAKTAAMNLPSTVGGAAFKGTDGKYTYVIWAKTTVDLSEAASAVYSFPNGLTNFVLNRQDWDWFKSKTVSISSTQNISLNATPIFLTETTVLNTCDNDIQPPVFAGCPQDIVLTTATASATASWLAPVATDNCGTPTVTSNYVSGASFNLGSTIVTYTALDAKANKATCSFTITVNSQSISTANCKKYIGTNVLNYCGCSDTRFHPYGMFFETVNTICPGILLYADQDITFQSNSDGTAKLKGTFRDSNWKPYIVDITFSGGTTIPPLNGSPNLFLCQTGKPVSVTNGWQYFTSMTGTVKYNNSTFTISRRNEAAQFGIGANTQVTDQLGLSAPFILSDGTKGDFKLNLANEQIVPCSNANICDNDTIPPVFNSCPANIIVSTTGTTANATWVTPTATDNCSATVSLSGNFLSGSPFPIGNTTVKYVAADAKGNKGTCSFIVTVTQQAVASGSDLSVGLSSSLTSFKQFTPADFRITLKNLGTTAFTDVKVALKTPVGLVGGDLATVSTGTWQIYCSGSIKCATWTIPIVAGGATETLDISFYVLDVTTPIISTATLTASTPTDTNTSNNQSSLTLTQALQPIQPTALLIPNQSVAIRKIAPNPTLDVAEMEIVSLEAQTINFVFYNAVGVLIKTETRELERGTNRLQFDASELSAGIYFVSPVTKNNRVVPTKFVKM